MSMNRYPRYTVREKVKADLSGISHAYVGALRNRLMEEWSKRREVIASELATGELSEYRHWLQALVEATHEIQGGMAPCETSLPGLASILREHGQSTRLLYTGLLVLSCWELGLTARSSEAALVHEAKMASVTPRALLELLKRAEPIHGTLNGAAHQTPNGEATSSEAAPIHSIVVRNVTGSQAAGSAKTELVFVLRDQFRQVEREILLRRLDVDPEDVKLNPPTREDFAWAMVSYFEHRSRLGDLWGVVQRDRPGSLAHPNPFL
jgi:hypothetical protein